MKIKRQQRHKKLLDAYDRAQQIAFGPMIFNAVAAALDLGLLKALAQSDQSLSVTELHQTIGISEYGVKVLAELLSCAQIIKRTPEQTYQLDTIGECLLFDEMTRVNFNFVRYVNYLPGQFTTQSIQANKPRGLQVFNSGWSTIYPHLKDLPPAAQKAWFEFDHYYSDVSFTQSLELLKNYPKQHLCDIGGNSGKFAQAALSSDEQLKVTVVDLPEQIELINDNPDLNNVRSRLNTYSIDWLDERARLQLNEPADLIWMSQFLDCFSNEQAVMILKKAQESLSEHGHFAILEPLWDVQKMATSSLCLTATSLYFSILANGYSRFFGHQELLDIIDQAGLIVESEHSGLGISHTLLICRRVG